MPQIATENRSPQATVSFGSMRDSHHQNHQLIVVDRVEDSELPHSDTVRGRGDIGQLDDAGRSRVDRQTINPSSHLPLCRFVQLSKLPPRGI